MMVLLIIGCHNLYAGCEHMLAECYLHGADDWSIAKFCFGILFYLSLLVLLIKLLLDAVIFILKTNNILK